MLYSEKRKQSVKLNDTKTMDLHYRSSVEIERLFKRSSVREINYVITIM